MLAEPTFVDTNVLVYLFDSDAPEKQTRAQALLREETGREAVSEADKGAFISQAAMDAWVSSWGEDAELPPPEPDVQISSQ